jgi:hypothetical protein
LAHRLQPVIKTQGKIGMKQKELFQHYAMDVGAKLDDGANPKELIEVLAAVSVNLAFQTAPTPEYALLAVLDGLRDMTLARVEGGKEEGHVAEGDDNDSEPAEEVNEGLEPDSIILANTTIH